MGSKSYRYGADVGNYFTAIKSTINNHHSCQDTLEKLNFFTTENPSETINGNCRKSDLLQITLAISSKQLKRLKHKKWDRGNC
jgi:Tfp pilus assembly protein PilV